MSKHRLGQGAFRIVVTDAYRRRCAITGEKTLPVLEAAHIIPNAENGPHIVTNGLLLMFYLLGCLRNIMWDVYWTHTFVESEYELGGKTLLDLLIGVIRCSMPI